MRFMCTPRSARYGLMMAKHDCLRHNSSIIVTWNTHPVRREIDELF